MRDAPADRIRAWLEQYMINNDGMIGWIDPSYGDPDAVKDLLDRLLPCWRDDVPEEGDTNV